MPRFKHKPTIIDAIQFRHEKHEEVEKWARDLGASGRELFYHRGLQGETFLITTLEGDIIARPGDWIVRGRMGELYPVKDEIFQEIYEPA